MPVAKERVGLVDIVLIVLAAGAVGIAGLSYFAPRARPAGSIASITQSLVGTRLPPLRLGAGDSGTMLSLASSRAPSLILVFRSTCPFCEQNSPSWTSLVDSLPAGYRVVALNAGQPELAQGWLAAHALRVSTLVVPASPADLAAWKITAVPMTLLVDGTARVLFAKAGVLTVEDLASLRRLVPDARRSD